MYGSVYSDMGAYSGSFWPVSECMVAKKSQLDHILFYRTLWDVHQHVSVLRTSTPVCWSFGSHNYMVSSRLWPSVLPYVGQLRSYLCWSGYKGSIQGRHTLPMALLLCWKLLDAQLTNLRCYNVVLTLRFVHENVLNNVVSMFSRKVFSMCTQRCQTTFHITFSQPSCNIF